MQISKIVSLQVLNPFKMFIEKKPLLQLPVSTFMVPIKSDTELLLTKLDIWMVRARRRN